MVPNASLLFLSFSPLDSEFVALVPVICILSAFPLFYEGVLTAGCPPKLEEPFAP